MSRRVEILMWVGVLGAPLAWWVEHIGGWGASEATCSGAVRRWDIPFTTWVATLTAVGALLAITGIVSAAAVFRAVRGAGTDADPPPGRLWLMSVCGLVISPLLLVLILLSGAGALLLGHCHAG